MIHLGIWVQIGHRLRWLKVSKIVQYITQTSPCKYTAIFHGCKIGNFQIKRNLLFFLNIAQNIDRGYTLDVRRFKRVPTIYVLEQNKKKNVYSCKPHFYYIKVGTLQKHVMLIQSKTNKIIYHHSIKVHRLNIDPCAHNGYRQSCILSVDETLPVSKVR